MSDALNTLLARSAELEVVLLPYLEISLRHKSERIEASRIMCGVAFEHAESVKMLIATGNFTSALGLIRLQYEALVRAMWLFYTAPENVVSKLLNEFTRAAVGNSEKLAMQAEMLKGLEEKAPSDAMISLVGFKENSWKPLSSYVHGGIHALQRHSKGYPVVLLVDTLKASNALSTMAAMHSIILSFDPSFAGQMRTIQISFRDCLPPEKTANDL